MELVKKVNNSIEKLFKRTQLTPFDREAIALFLGDIDKVNLDYESMYKEVSVRLQKINSARNSFTWIGNNSAEDMLIGDLSLIEIKSKTYRDSFALFVLTTIQLIICEDLMNIEGSSPLEILFKMENSNKITSILDNSFKTFFYKSTLKATTFDELIGLTTPRIEGYNDLIIKLNDGYFCIYENSSGDLNIKYVNNGIIKELPDTEMIESIFI